MITEVGVLAIVGKARVKESDWSIKKTDWIFTILVLIFVRYLIWRFSQKHTSHSEDVIHEPTDQLLFHKIY